MKPKKNRSLTESFTEQDVENLLSDLELYSGNIKEITIHGMEPHVGTSIYGEIRTCMDTFSFSALAFLSDDDSWYIQLANPAESLRRGHRSIQSFRVPKIHRSKELENRYIVANHLFRLYNNYTNRTEADRNSEYEAMLGYEKLKTLGHVIEAIIKDYRSYEQKKQAKEKALRSKN